MQLPFSNSIGKFPDFYAQDNPIKLAIVGLGYWGPNLVRNFSQLKSVTIKTLCDRVLERAVQAQRKFAPTAIVTTDFNDVLLDDEIQAVVLCTPASTHYELAFQVLTARRHVLVEKPLAISIKQAQRLAHLAAVTDRVLMTDNTFLHSAAIKKIKELLDTNVIGDISFVSSNRSNLGLFRDDVDVVWDLGPHDVSIIAYLLNSQPSKVTMRGITATKRNRLDVCYLDLDFPNKKTAHVVLSWLSPRKIRELLLVGSLGMIVYDDTQETNKIAVHLNNGSYLNLNKLDSTFVPFSDEEPLHVLCNEFVKRIQTGDDVVDRERSVQVVKILASAHESFGLQVPVCL